MRGWFSRRAKPSAAPDADLSPPRPTSPPPPPPPLHSGVPFGARALAVNPVQGTVAIGGSAGEIKVLTGSTSTVEMLIPPQELGGPIQRLLFDANEGRLLALHAPALLRVWDLRRALPAVEATLSLATPSQPDPVITAACMLPPAPFALFGTEGSALLACDVRDGSRGLAGWAVTVGSGAGSGAVCALEPRPLDSQTVLVALRRGVLQVLRLGTATPRPPTTFAPHPEGTGLTCAAWVCDGGGGGGGGGSGSGTVAAGYENGDVLLFSLRAPARPAATLVVNPYASGVRRPIRYLACMGASPAAERATPTLVVSGGTSREADPDALVLMRGANLSERSMLAPPRGAALVAASLPDDAVASGATPMLANGTPARPEHLLVLTTGGDVLRYSMRRLGSAPTRLPDAADVDAAEAGLPRVRLTLTCWGAGARCQAALSVSTPLSATSPLPSRAPPAATPLAATPPAEKPAGAAIEAEQAAEALALVSESLAELEAIEDELLPRAAPLASSPFFDSTREATRASAGGVLGSAARWLGEQGEGGGSDVGSRSPSSPAASASPSAAPGGGLGRWLGDGLSWATREIAKHQEASRAEGRAVQQRELDALFFPPSSSRAAATPAASPAASPEPPPARGMSEEEARAALLSGGKAKAAAGGRRGAAGEAATPLAGASGATRAMGENLEAMHERGEKLGELGDKSQQLADHADDFLSLARELRKQQERPFFGIF